MFNSERHMTVGDWLIFHLLMAIPLVNIIIYIMLLISGDTNPSLRSYLALPIIVVIIVFIIIFILVAIGYTLPQIGAMLYV